MLLRVQWLCKATPGDKHNLPINRQCRVNINSLNGHRTLPIHKFQFSVSIQSSGKAFLRLKTSVDTPIQDSNRVLCSRRLLLNSSMQCHRRAMLKTSNQLRRILLLNRNTRNDDMDLSNPSNKLSRCEMPGNRGILAKKPVQKDLLIQLVTRPKLRSRKIPAV